MPFVPASPASVAAFVVIALAVAATFLAGVWRACGPVCVSGAIAGHLVFTRALLRRG